MKLRVLTLLSLAVVAFTGCGGSATPSVAMIPDFKKNIVDLDIEAKDQQMLEKKIVNAINDGAIKCGKIKKSKHLIFDTYYSDKCKISHSIYNGELKRVLKTYRTSVTKTVGKTLRKNAPSSSELAAYAPIHITKNDKGYHVSIDAVSRVRSDNPDGVDHYWDQDEFVGQFNTEIEILILKTK